MIKIVPGADQINIFDGNECIGYVENETLYCFNRDGFAVEVCHVSSQIEIVSKVREWQLNHSN